MIQSGDLIRVIKAPDQSSYMMTPLWDKLGVVIERVEVNSSPNIWKVWVNGYIVHLHILDFIKVG